MNESLCAARSHIAHAMDSLAGLYLSEARRDEPAGQEVRAVLRLLSSALHDLVIEQRGAKAVADESRLKKEALRLGGCGPGLPEPAGS